MATLARMNWVALGLAFVRFRPKTSVAIAFEVGMIAAQALTRMSRSNGVSEIKYIDLAPTMSDPGEYLDRRRTKPSTLRAKKPAAKRTPRVKKAS